MYVSMYVCMYICSRVFVPCTASDSQLNITILINKNGWWTPTEEKRKRLANVCCSKVLVLPFGTLGVCDANVCCSKALVLPFGALGVCLAAV